MGKRMGTEEKQTLSALVSVIGHLTDLVPAHIAYGPYEIGHEEKGCLCLIFLEQWKDDAIHGKIPVIEGNDGLVCLEGPFSHVFQ